ncbi:MAG: SusC/RagA family TonB-linked outer membrane protein [Spirosomaceae bacterium]|nr:SusC/RagA family TonB-linked outer membrane protein [Spirosomataceae bacterium]
MKRTNYVKVLQLLTLLVLSVSVFAQDIAVKGKVMEDNGSLLYGVNVTVKGSNKGTVTNDKGEYSISVPKGTVLTYSFVGFISKDVVVNSSNLDVRLSAGDNVMNEIVVTAFGMAREKKALAYSVSQVDGSKFQESRTANLGNALTGKIAGVVVSPPASGAAGSSRVIIRGGSSLGGNDQPLYVVNGVPIESGNFGQAGMWGGNDSGDGLAMLNPDDIENISVLKGNTAAALYGARAANGVIMITTKSGKARKGIGVSYNSNFTSDRAVDLTDFQRVYGPGINGSKFTNQNEALDQATSIWGARYDGSNTISFDGQQRPYSHTGQTINDFYRSGNTWNNSLAFSGGNESGTYRLAFSDLRNSDVIPNASFKRQTANLNLNSKLKKLTLTLSAQYTMQNALNRPRLSDSPGNANFSVIAMPPTTPYSVIRGTTDKFGANPDGTELRYQGNVFSTNPYWAAYQFFRSDISNRLVANTSLRYDFTDWLYVMGRLGTDYTGRDAASSEPYGTAYKPLGDYNETFQKVRQDNYELFIGGQKTFGKIFIDYMVGGSQLRTDSKTKGVGGNDLVVPFFHSINNVRAPNRIFGFAQLGTNSVFGSFNAGYDNWLFLNVTGRQDQFSTLAPENNTLFYPSVGVSAILSDALKLPSAITFAKVRASWAQVGGGGPDPYALNVTYGLLGNPHGSANLGQINNGSIPNPSLSPYTSTEFEVGADVRLFKNRLGLDVAVYNRKTTNDILNAGISATSGFGSTSVNVGELTNRGIEILLNGVIIERNGFKWDATFNFSRNISEAVNLGANAKGEPIQFLNLEESRVRGGERVRHILGEQLGMIIGWKHRTNAQGQKFYDANGYPVRSASPEIIGMGRHPISAGFSNTLRYKNASLSFLIDVRQGGSIFSGTNWWAYRTGLHQETLAGREGDLRVSGVLFDQATNRETDTPVNVTIPKDRIDDYWTAYSNITENIVYDASYAKLRELSIGYTIPKKLLGKIPFESASISIVGRNLALLWSNVPNIDPESGYTVASGAQGLEFFAMPQTRNFGVNLNLNF